MLVSFLSSSRQLRDPYIFSSQAARRQQMPPSRHYSGIIYIMLHDALSGNKGITTVTIYTRRLVYSIQLAWILCITFFSSNMAKRLKKPLKSKHRGNKIKAAVLISVYKLSQVPSQYDIRGHANGYLKIGPTQVRYLNHENSLPYACIFSTLLRELILLTLLQVRSILLR